MGGNWNFSRSLRSVRRFVLKLALISAISLTCVIALWKGFRADERLKITLENRWRSVTSDSLSIGSLYLYPTSILFREIQLFSERDLQLSIARFRVNFSLLELLYSKGDWMEAVSEIHLENPQLLITVNNRSDTENSDSHRFSSEIFQKLKLIYRLDKILISDGSLHTRSSATPLIESIEVSLTQAGSRKLKVNGSGSMSHILGTKINLSGEMDLEAEELLLELSINNNDLSKWDVARNGAMLSHFGGWFQSRFEIQVNEELILTGKIAAHDIEMKYGKLVILNMGSIDAELSGNTISYRGDIVFNGLNIPFQGGIIDIFEGRWYLKILEDHMDISKLELLLSKKIMLAGNADFKVELTGDRSDIAGIMQFNSDSISIENMWISDINLGASVEEDAILINDFSAELFGADLKLGGFVSLASGENRIDWFVEKLLFSNENTSRFGLDSTIVSMVGTLSGVAGELVGAGNCDVMDAKGNTFLGWDFDIDGYTLVGQMYADRNDVAGSFEIDFSTEPPTTLIVGVNPHRILKNTSSGKFVADDFHSYEMEYEVKGDLKNYEFDVKIISDEPAQSCQVTGKLGISALGGVGMNGAFKFFLPNDKLLAGNFDIALDSNAIMINMFQMQDEKDSTVMTLTADIKLAATRSNEIDLSLMALPFTELFRFFYPDKIPIAEVSGNLNTKDYNSVFDFVFNFNEEHLPNYTLDIKGLAECDNLTIDNFSLENADEEIVFSLRGGIDLSTVTIDHLIIVADNLSLEHIARAITGEDSSDFGGRINMVAHAGGDLPFPNINVNAHLSEAYFHDMPDFWGNLHIVTEDSVYVMYDSNIGLELKKIVSAEGRFNRKSEMYDVSMISTEQDIQDFVRLFTGKSGVVAGSSNLEVNFNNKDAFHNMSADIIVKSGRIGNVGFDQLQGKIFIENLGTEFSVLSIDTFGIDWGSLVGNVQGFLPLNVSEQIALKGDVEGKLLAFLPRLDTFFSYPEGNGNVEFEISGTIQNPFVCKANLRLSNGSIKMKDIVSEVESLDINISLDTTGVIRVSNFQGEVDGKPFQFSNRLPVIIDLSSPDADRRLSNLPESSAEHAIILGKYNLGIIQFSTGDEGIWARIPGLMEGEWGGYTVFSGMDDRGWFEISGPVSKPIGAGKIRLRKANLTYPFIVKNGIMTSRFSAAVIALLKRMEWNAEVVPEWGCKYIYEISGLKGMPFYEEIQSSISSPLFDLDLKIYLDLQLEESIDGLYFSGAIDDSLRISGHLTSTRGTIEYLDMKFSAQKISAEFNPSELNPLFYGSAGTTIIDSADVPHEIRLVTRRHVRDEAGGFSTNQDAPARWEDLNVVFEDDQNNSQEQILAMMGYSPETIDEKLPGLGGSIVERAIPIKQFTRRLERQLERWLKVDRIDIEPTLTQNIIQQQLISGVEDRLYSDQYSRYLHILDQSSVTLGKYITRDIYVSYTGLLQSGADNYNFTRLGMLHDWDLMLKLWQIAPNLNFNYRYQYDSLAELSDHSFRIRLNFTFDI